MQRFDKSKHCANNISFWLESPWLIFKSDRSVSPCVRSDRWNLWVFFLEVIEQALDVQFGGGGWGWGQEEACGLTCACVYVCEYVCVRVWNASAVLQWGWGVKVTPDSRVEMRNGKTVNRYWGPHQQSLDTQDKAANSGVYKHDKNVFCTFDNKWVKRIKVFSLFRFLFNCHDR